MLQSPEVTPALTQQEQIVSRLRELCARVGGYKVVASEAGVSADNLRQVLQGAKLAGSGAPRSIGRRVQDSITARFPGWLDQQHQHEGSYPPRGAVAQVLSQYMESYSPQYTWEDIMRQDALPITFRVAMPDDSMTPRVRRGDIVEFDSRESPRTGDGVLVRDNQGSLYFRVFRQGKPGAWEAHPINADYLPLQSVADGLAVVGVMVGLPKHRWA